MTNFKIIFLHLPKTGGLTLYDILERQYKKGEVYTIKIKNKRPALQEFINLPDIEKTKIKVLRGHMPFGYHQFLQEEAKYITVLRNPVDRVISHYYYILEHPDHYLYDKVKGMKVEEYVISDVTHELDNGQIRDITEIQENEKCTAEHFEIAKKRLEENFLFASVLDYFDEGLIILKDMLGWSYPTYYTINKKKGDRPKISAEIKAQIAEKNKYDLELYKLAKQKVEAIIQQKPDYYKQEVEKLHKLSYSYRQYGRLKEFVKGILGKE
jgi:hypothetical protein